MFVRKFCVRNYMNHRDTVIAPNPITVLVGPNGGGKSALFDAMLNFSMLARGNLRQAFGPYPYSFHAKISRSAHVAPRICFEVTMSRSNNDDEALEYTISYAQQGHSENQPTFAIFDETIVMQPGNIVLFDRGDPERYPLTRGLRIDNDRSLFSALRPLATTDVDSPDLLQYLTQQISRFNKFRLDPSALGSPSRMPDLHGASQGPLSPRLGHRGEDLASVLYYLTETKSMSPALEAIRNNVRVIEPAFEAFEFTFVGEDRVAFSLRYSDERQLVPSVNLSNGTLLYIGLIVLVTTPNRPPVLMIEEPENGLTPQAIYAFYNALRTLALNEQEDQRSQIFISSHSPFVVCVAWNGDDRDFIHQVRNMDGRAVVRKFSDVIQAHGIQLARDAEGNRGHLSLKNAEEIMSGRHA